MEKYAKLLKGLEVCAGPECCKDGCPYYNTTTGGMTCRARLLLDASVAIMNERSSAVAALQDREAAEKENDVLRERCREKDKMLKDCKILQNEINALRTTRNELEVQLQETKEALDTADADYAAMAESARAERDGMRIELERLTEDNKRFRMLCQGKTDQASVGENELRNEYKRGYLDAMEYCFRELCKRAGGGCCHE